MSTATLIFVTEKIDLFPFLHIQNLITEQKISWEALLANEKEDIKEIGVQPMGRGIEIMIKELLRTQEKQKAAEVEPKVEKDSLERKISFFLLISVDLQSLSGKMRYCGQGTKKFIL